jgi:hypothetical protein
MFEPETRIVVVAVLTATALLSATAIGVIGTERAVGATVTDGEGESIQSAIDNASSTPGIRNVTVRNTGEHGVNVSVGPYDTDAALTSPTSKVTVSGVILTEDGTPATNDFVTANPVDTGERDPAGLVVERTSDGGAFSLAVESDQRYDIRVFQFGESTGTLGVDDGTVDMYAVDRRSFGSDVDYGEITLPEGYELNITVVDESETPVENANVSLRHTDDTVGATAALVDSPTTSEGRMVAKEIPDLGVNRSEDPGLELVGNVTITVAPPPGSSLTGNDTQLSLDSDRTVTVKLESGGLPTDPGEPGFGDVLAVIQAFNTNSEYADSGVTPGFGDVLEVISAFNAG